MGALKLCPGWESNPHVFWTKDFKSFAYTIPPPGLEAWTGIEPVCKGFADPCLTTWLPGHTKEIVAGILAQIKLLYNVVYEDRHI